MNSKIKLLSSTKIKGTVLLFNCILSLCLPSFAQMGKWTELHPLHSPPNRTNHSMADIADGKVILFGGIGYNGVRLNDTWIFDIQTNDWKEITTEPRPPKIYNHKMARITDNKVLLFGGEDGYLYYNETWVFDLDSNRWYQIFPQKLPAARSDFALSQMSDKKIFLYSGWVPEYDYPMAYDTWIYNLEKNEWDSVKSTNRFGSGTAVASTMLDTGIVLTYGGWAGNFIEETGIFDETTRLWKKLIPKIKPIPLRASTITNLYKNVILLFGGSGEGTKNTFLNITWVFSLKDTSWKELTFLDEQPRGRAEHTMAKIGDGKALLFGGSIDEVGNARVAGDTWLFELDTNLIGVEEKPAESIAWRLSNNQLIIFFPYKMDPRGIKKISTYDILGQEIPAVKDYRVQGNTITVDLDPALMKSGLYFAVVDCGTARLALKFAKE